MESITIFSDLLKFNSSFLIKSLAGIPDESYFIRPEKRGNPLMWLLGHIIVNRGEIVEILGGEPRLGNLADLFARGTYPQGNSSVYPSPEEMIARLAKISSLTDHLLKNVDPGLMDKASWGKFETVGQNLAFSYMHETHHLGQITYIVNLPGIKNVKKPSTIFKKPEERKNSTAKILISNLKSVFA